VPHLLRDVHDRRREVDVARVAVEADRDAALGLHALELGQEVDVEIRAAELAVGDAAQAQGPPGIARCRDRRVLDGAQRLGRESRPSRSLARLEERARAQEAADVVGAERRLLSYGGAGRCSGIGHGGIVLA
jgi:hypothetical protein